jgi:hypothetical protein
MAVNQTSALLGRGVPPNRIPAYESYRVKIPYVLDVTKLADSCTPHTWEQQTKPVGRYQDATWSPNIKVTTCNNRPVRIDKWSFVPKLDCKGEEAFASFQVIPVGRLSQTTDDSGTLIDVLPGVEITTCYDEAKTAVPLDCQGKWYNKPTWRFAYNVTLPHDAVMEPDGCGLRFKDKLKEKTRWQITYWECKTVGDAARILFQTEPLTHHRWVHAAVSEYSGGEYKLDRDGPIRCPYFNQVELPPSTGYCSAKKCKGMKFKDFRTGNVV